MTITCKACNTTKPRHLFHKDSRTRSGHKSTCSTCSNTRKRTSYYADSNRPLPPHKDATTKICTSCKTSKHIDEFYSKTAKRRTSKCKGCLSHERLSPSVRLQDYKSSARKRGKIFTLTEADIIHLWNQPCTYCGEPINGVGLDRVDNSIGYTPENVVSCCKTCNTMKLHLSVDEWVNRMRMIITRLDQPSAM